MNRSVTGIVLQLNIGILIFQQSKIKKKTVYHSLLYCYLVWFMRFTRQNFLLNHVYKRALYYIQYSFIQAITIPCNVIKFYLDN